MLKNNINKKSYVFLILEQSENINNLSGSDLPNIQEFLKSLGLNLVEYDLNNPTNIAGNPLISNGLNGIRATYDKKKDILKIWYTNIFQNSNNEIRKQLEQFLLKLKYKKGVLKETMIVDNKNYPMIVYRSQKDDRTQTENRIDNLKGIYFSADKDSTKIYGENTKEYFLNIKNPFILKDKEWNLSVLPDYYYNALIEKGYDGAIWLRKGIMYEIIAFYTWQVIPISENI